MKRLFALVAIALTAALAGCASGSGSHAATQPAPRYVTQPAFQPGVHDAGAMRRCELGLKPVVVAYGPNAASASGWSFTGDSRAASRLAFHLQAVAYDRCTGRNFERSPERPTDPGDVGRRLVRPFKP